MKISSLLLSLLAFCVEVNCQSQCSPVGPNNEMEFTAAAVTPPSVYLNVDYPARCSGTVERWEFCFYRPATHKQNDSYRLTFAVYRGNGSGNNTRYEIVGSSLHTITRRFGVESSNFSCQFLDRNVGNLRQFNIEAGDIIGACIFDPTNPSIEPMDAISAASGYSLMQDTQSVGTPCGFRRIPSPIPRSRLLTVNSRLLHLSAIVAATASTTQSTSVASTSDTTTTDTTTSMSTSSRVDPTVSELPDEITSTGGESTINQTDATSESTIASTSTASTINTTTAATVEQPTSESTGTIDRGTTTSESVTQASQTTTSDSDIVNITLAVTTAISTDDDGATSAVTETRDTTITRDDSNSSTTEGQSSAENRGGPNPTIIAGGIVAVVLVSISGIAIITVIVVVIKKRGKTVGAYSLPNNSDSTPNNIPNGVDNVTYGMGFHNPEAVDTSVSLCDDLTKSVSAGEGNYFELAASGLSNTYESVTAGVYSELSAANSTTDTQLQHADDRNTHGETSCYELEYDYTSAENFNASFSLLLEKNKQEDIYGNLEAYYAPASNEDEIYSQLKSCGIQSIPHNQIKIVGHLGSGQFGNVEKGMWQSKEVALKSLKTDSTDEDKVKFLQEAAIMAQFKHPNIVTLHGVVSNKEPLMLVVEMMHRGDLRDHLHSLRPDPGELQLADLPQTLLIFSQHVALGMQYLSGKGFVHRDLAARNILVSRDNICKVADFGMSRDLADETYYVSHGGRIPVKWTAPEAIHYRKYSTASDVWSYGCLLYEIWSLGYKPFEGMANNEVVKLLDSNKRLSPPPGCPRMIYELMIRCWDPIAGSRPVFREIAIVLTGNPQKVLSIPQEVVDTHKLAGVLGSPLEVGNDTYKDLKDKYCSECNVYD